MAGADCGEWGRVVLQSQECFDVSWGIASTAMLEMLFVDGAYSSTMFDGLKKYNQYKLSQSWGIYLHFVASESGC